MNFVICPERNHKKGFGLVEVLVSIAIFTLISVSAYSGFVKIMQGISVLKVKNAATNLANEQIEIVRNLPYDDVGVVDGLPEGKIPRDQVLVREGIEFNVNVSVRDIDDPFDGQIGEEPNDLSPADYKLVEFSIICSECAYQNELKYYARVSPMNLETQGDNGALFVRVFDSNGLPLQGADVHIENNLAEDPIIIDETTNNFGMFQIVDAPTGTAAYEVTVTKDNDYSTDKTYPINDPTNPIPDRPHANVVSGEVTQLSFYIDKLSDVEVYTRKSTCSIVSNVDFNIIGSKTIGYGVRKTNFDTETNSAGYKLLDDLEWDSYMLNIIDSSWDLVGGSSILPIEVNPDSNQSIYLILAPKKENALQISVIDSENDLPVSDAEVTLSDGSDEITLVTGQGFAIQTDWSGGAGQQNYTDETRYLSSDGNIEDNDPVGDIRLDDFSGTYVSSGMLESSIFDMGTTTNFGHIFWNPVSQATSTGPDNVRVQLATAVDIATTTTWVFAGPDGTQNTYYTDPGQIINSVHDGSRYLKYKIYLSTDNTSVTPTVSNISFTVMNECNPPGQVLFSDLDLGEYAISVNHTDYQDFLLDGYSIDEAWQSQKITLIPND